MAYSTVLYPNTSSLNFNMDYYLSTHMPLVAKVWGPFGLQRWEVIQFDAGPDGSPPPHAVQAVLHWSKVEDVQVVARPESKEVFEDVKNFSGEAPVFLTGRWVGKADTGAAAASSGSAKV